jgi:hypothetical protein
MALLTRFALTAGLFSLGAAAGAQEPTTAPEPTPATDLLTASAEPPPSQEPRKPPLGGMGGLGIGGPGGGGPGYDVRGYFARPVTGQPTDLGLVRQNLNVMAPLWRDGPDMLMGSVRVRNLFVDTAAVLPDTGQPFPTNLWDIQFGLTGIRQLENGWTAGLMGSIGSASDRPFYGIDEMTLSTMGFLKVPALRDGDSWLFSFMYSPNGQVAFPIPGVRYDWNPSERLNVGIGIPFSVRWTPTDEWRMDLSYLPLTTVNAKMTWTPGPRFSAYAGFEWDSEGYFLVDRRETRDRFFYLEKRLVGGVRLSGFGRAVIDITGGYAFDRSFGAGRNPLDYQYDVVDVAPGPFLGGRVGMKF